MRISDGLKKGIDTLRQGAKEAVKDTKEVVGKVTGEVVSEGGITGTVADPRPILKTALEQNAVSLILCHNHPSGSLRPSRADEELTRKIREAARYLDITVLDHLIVSEEGYFSFADDGLL